MFQAGENPASVWAASGELLSGSTVTSSMISDDFRNQQSKWWINLRMHKPSNRLSRQQTPNNVKEGACRKKQ